MNNKIIWVLLFACVLSMGVFFRLWRLADRPMHTDESVHAEKFKALLQEGFYAYDPEEYHGPTLNYFTLISAYLRGETKYSEINEATLRLVPAAFGILLILTPLFFIRILGIRTVLFCSALIAFSPGFIYYSRYYIQETLLLFFTACLLGCLYHCLYHPSFLWCVLSGLLIGLMHATKETFIFSIAAVMVAVVVGLLSRDIRSRVKLLHLMCGVAVMLLASVLFYSSFGQNPNGVFDSIRTYFIWMQRSGSNSVHAHPWYFYLDLLTWFEFIEPLTWNEDGIVGFFVIGLILMFLKQGGRRYRCARFLAMYTLVLTVIYSVIPYKTPWSMMSFVYGMVFVAGFAADRLLRYAQLTATRSIYWILIVVYGLAAPMGQSWFLNFRYAADPVNPYVYAHTNRDVYVMTEAVDQAAEAWQTDKEIPIQIIASGDDYWPLPWYLRNYSYVSYWSHVDDSVCDVPMILANAKLEQPLLDKLYSVPEPGQRHLYVPLFDEAFYLRPQVQWKGYIRKDLWDRMQQKDVSATEQLLSEKPLLQSHPDRGDIKNLVKFSHIAMHTNFEIFIQDTRSNYAGRAARAAFNEVDRLEQLLSRYIENSDISRINSLSQNEEVIVDKDTLHCLQVARNAWELTDGAFDITIGDVISAWKNGNNQAAVTLLENRAGMNALHLKPELFTVTVTNPLTLDLGGIGKGYAVDVIERVLTEWGIERALIHGGTSSVKAMKAPEGQKGWKVTTTSPMVESHSTVLHLKDESLSCSGLEEEQHIFNPFTGKPVTDRRACWVRTKKTAALADALSTAGMIMNRDQIQQLQNDIPDTSFLILTSEIGSFPHLLRIGIWEAD